MADGHRSVPGAGHAERSKVTRKISVAFDNETFARLVRTAQEQGISTSAVVRNIVAAAASAERG